MMVPEVGISRKESSQACLFVIQPVLIEALALAHKLHDVN